MAVYLRATGERTEVEPADGERFSLAELQGLVGGSIEMLGLRDGRWLVLHEEGKFVDEPVVNVRATQLAWGSRVIGRDDRIVGDVVLLTADEADEDTDEDEDDGATYRLCSHDVECAQECG